MRAERNHQKDGGFSLSFMLTLLEPAKDTSKAATAVRDTDGSLAR
jgi:hypothetical protein